MVMTEAMYQQATAAFADKARKYDEQQRQLQERLERIRRPANPHGEQIDADGP